jgi:hypothetical protein
MGKIYVHHEAGKQAKCTFVDFNINYEPRVYKHEKLVEFLSHFFLYNNNFQVNVCVSFASLSLSQ